LSLSGELCRAGFTAKFEKLTKKNEKEDEKFLNFVPPVAGGNEKTSEVQL
jgi:hypothetical protein